MNLFARTARPKKADANELHDLQAMLAAVHRTLAVIEFELDGTIVRANQKFLDAMGYADEDLFKRNQAHLRTV